MIEDPQCDNDRNLGVVCGNFHNIAFSLIRSVSVGSPQVEPARITVLPDRRVRLEEHLKRTDVGMKLIAGFYEDSLSANGWSPLPTNAPFSLRYQITTEGRTYAMAIDFRDAADSATGDAGVFIDAVIETVHPVP